MEIACPMLPPNLGIRALTEKNAFATHEIADLSPFVQIALVCNNYRGAVGYTVRGPAALGDGGDRLFSGEEVLTASACSCVLCDRHLHPRHLVASRGSSLLQPQRGLSPRQENQTHRAAVHSALRFGSCDVFEPTMAGCNRGTERPFHFIVPQSRRPVGGLARGRSCLPMPPCVRGSSTWLLAVSTLRVAT